MEFDELYYLNNNITVFLKHRFYFVVVLIIVTLNRIIYVFLSKYL